MTTRHSVPEQSERDEETDATMRSDTQIKNRNDHATDYALIEPHAAFNIFLQSSIILLDCCAAHIADVNACDVTQTVSGCAVSARCTAEAQLADGCADSDDDEMPALPEAWSGESNATRSVNSHDGGLPGSAWLDPGLSLQLGAERAYAYVMDERTPDDSSRAMVLYDDHSRLQQLAAWLKTECGCRRVLAVRRDALQAEHGFLFYPGAHELVMPSEICAGRLYLGSAASANATALRLLRITHVVSLLERPMELPTEADGAPSGMRHLLLHIADRRTADLDATLRQALPFVMAALESGKGRVLVHCEAGMSRSASVVIATILADPRLAGANAPFGLDEVISFVRAQRLCVRPNDGFLERLAAQQWRAPTEAVAVDWF